ncbi:hypothetical protein SAMN04488127_0697 [Bhargavaea ginsengi]|uniref:Uncharacterized protein n=1 Tax=Bhargavaea ginsengi TaxID=426757 RepID=A0A1H6UJ39_9BACL|nr:hypothetical protein [Bhargavaea ginsengi]SEI88185.1 hypothetical protein SAMN04488127_0697 [Bhargavaea ginsengi]
MEKERRYYDVWGDSVDLKDLLISIVLCITGTLGGYIIAPNEPPMPLVFGLAGGVIAFIACSVFIRPKRNVHAEEEDAS